MNEEYNLSSYHNHPDPSPNITVTPLMIDYLRATKPWVRFLSILMFVMVGLMLVGGLVMMLSGATGLGATGPILGLVYWVMAILYLAPAYFLFQFASSIGNLLQGGGDVAMEAALGSQKSFWRFTGIVTLVIVCIYALVIVTAILGGLVMGGLYQTR